ncbi:MAG: T9SS type A sorting domain-containing protein [Bacteroidota bacterium]
MKQLSTLKTLFFRKESLLFAGIFTLLFVFGCYEFKTVDQPVAGYTNSSFDVNIVMTEDDDPSNDWSWEDGSLTKTGLIGILLPEGWTINDNIALHVEAADSLSDGQGGWLKPASNHDGDYTIVYNAEQTTMLNDSTPTPPAGYYWWGGVSSEPLDMAYFDSLYFTVTFNTDDKTGDFYLQYAVGDADYWGRMPYDPNVITDPMLITITQAVSVPSLLTESALELYPTPSNGYLNVDLKNYNGEQVELSVYDMRGREMKHQTLNSAHTTLDIVDFAAGTYLVRMKAGDEAITKKIVKN